MKKESFYNGRISGSDGEMFGVHGENRVVVFRVQFGEKYVFADLIIGHYSFRNIKSTCFKSSLFQDSKTYFKCNAFQKYKQTLF